MAPEAKPYIRTFEDELDWKLFDQLHTVVSQISSFCFETKKFCVTTEFVVMTLLVKFTLDKLDHSLFLTGLIIPLCFWFLDAVGYFYQVKIRVTMESIRLRLATRNVPGIVGSEGTGVIAQSRVTRTVLRRVVDAFINNSMWLYAFLIVIDLVLWWLFLQGAIA
jgi:hypothetical protein